MLDYGNSVRSKGVSGVNPDSSRSHAVLQMEIRDSTDRRLGRYGVAHVNIGFKTVCSLDIAYMYIYEFRVLLAWSVSLRLKIKNLSKIPFVF